MKRLFVAALVAAMMCCTGCAAASGDAQMQLLAINVGKADCLLLQYGDALYMIDTGTEDSWGAISAVLHLCGVTHLDGVIITHTDKDHAGGASILAASGIEIGAWYASRYYTGVKESKHPAMEAAQLRGQTVVWLGAGDTLPFGDGELRVLGPISGDDEKENNNSLVLLATAAGGSILLAGDMEFPEEEALLGAGVIPRCTVLKVGNHGEADATSPALVNAVKPQIALISTDTEAEPDTPAPRVMEVLRAADAEIVETQDAEAAVLVTVADGKATAQKMSLGVLPAQPAGLVLSDRDAGTDTIRLTNTGSQQVALAGWYIRSDKGGEIFIFPADAVIAPGESMVIGTQSTDVAVDYRWPDKKVWHKSKQDIAQLCDVYGRVVFELE